MRIRIFLFLLLFSVPLFSLSFASQAEAQIGNATTNIISNSVNQIGTAPTTTVNKNDAGFDPVRLENPLGTTTSIQIMIGNVINAILGVVGSLALLMFVFGGLTWMTSSGNQEKVKKGRDIIVWSAIGLVVIFFSYALTKFILTTLAK